MIDLKARQINCRKIYRFLAAKTFDSYMRKNTMRKFP